MPKCSVRLYWKTITICILIFILSAATFKKIPDIAKFQNSDKYTHMLMYIGLGFVFYYEYAKDVFFRKRYKNWFWGILLLFVLFGGVIEILQETFFKPRTGEFLDWIADTVGLLIGVGMGFLFQKKSR